MGLLLSVLVVCVGVLEAISCVRHFQHGYLPYWVPSRMRPICHEHSRRKPNDDDSSDECSDELSRILHNGGGVNINRKDSPRYGLTPILTEHRRHTPILRGDDEDFDDDTSGHPKYVENNIDECYPQSNHASLLTESFRPISPSEPEGDVPLDDSYVSSTGKFLEVPPEDSPLQRSSSEETLHDSEPEEVLSPSAVDQSACPVDENVVPSGVVETNLDEGLANTCQTQDVVFKVDEASPPINDYEGQEFSYPDSQFSQTIHLDEVGNNVTEEDEDLYLTNDPVYNLVSAAAYILRNESEYENSDILPRKTEPVLGTTSSCRPLSIDVTARIPTPQAHRESMPFDLMAAHASSGSRPETPSTPKRSKADISWPVFHPEPVIKRPVHSTDVDRGDSIEEDMDSVEGEILTSEPPVHPMEAPVDTTSHSIGRPAPTLEVNDQSVPSSKVPDVSSLQSSSDVLHQESSPVPMPANEVTVATPDSVKKSVPSSILSEAVRADVEPPAKKVAVTAATQEVGAVEDQCSRTVVRSLSSGPVTPFVTVPGSGCAGVHRSVFDDDCCRPGPTSVDKFGRFTCRPHKGYKKQRRGSLERASTVPDGGLKDSVMSKSLPDFFFEENMAKLGNAPSPTGAAPPEADVKQVVEEVPESEPVGKDITRKESSIKRRRGYRKKERSTWMPSRAKNRVSQDGAAEKAVSSTESFGETDEESKDGSVDISTSVDAVDSSAVLNTPQTPVSKVESGAISNSALAPVEILHHAEVQPESGVFAATTTQQPTKRLLKSAKSESFEEAPVLAPQPAAAKPPSKEATESQKQTTTQQLQHTQKTEPAKTVAREPPQVKSGSAPVEDTPRPPPPQASPPRADATGTRDVTRSARAPASKPDETKANNDDEEEDEEEDEDVEEDDDAAQSEATNIKQPQQSSVPAPFWLIFSGEYTKAMSKDWHSGHFCCWQCDESLTGQRYVLRDDHPYCIKCYESVFANMCEECSKTIGIDSKDLSYKDKHWHEACFLCNKCRVSLVDKQFGSKADKIYCSNCYDAQFASRCDGCGEIFRAGTKKMEYKTRQWHEKCFCCCVCKSAIGTKSFIPREQEIYCATCYEEKFATRCVKCNKIITSGGVTYKNEPWHRECFTCTHCNTSLAGQRFTSKEEKPYCAECFGELFAKRCTACVKPITGIGGTRFISFEDRHWHNDCFICASCKTSLVGRGFITDAEDIICPECAKQKLM